MIIGVGDPNVNSALIHTAETENLDSRGTLQMYGFRIGAPPAETTQADPIPPTGKIRGLRLALPTPPQGGSDSRTGGGLRLPVRQTGRQEPSREAKADAVEGRPTPHTPLTFSLPFSLPFRGRFTPEFPGSSGPFAIVSESDSPTTTPSRLWSG